MDKLKLHKGKLFNAYQSLEKVLDEEFVVNKEVFTILNVDYSRHAEFSTLTVTIKYDRQVKFLRLFATEEGISNRSETLSHMLELTDRDYMINPKVLEAICKEIRATAEQFVSYYSSKQKVLEYLNKGG